LYLTFISKRLPPIFFLSVLLFKTQSWDRHSATHVTLHISSYICKMD